MVMMMVLCARREVVPSIYGKLGLIIMNASQKDDRSPISSGNESDESSDVDSPGPPSLKTNQAVLTDVPAAQDTTPSNSQSHNEPQDQISTTSTSIANEPIYYDVFKTSTPTQSQPNNIVYPASALANIPQEVLLGLIQSGHLQLHTEEDGSGHQYITIPLSMAAAAAAAANNNGGGSTQVKDLSSRASSSRETPTSSAAVGSSSSRETIRVKKEFVD